MNDFINRRRASYEELKQKEDKFRLFCTQTFDQKTLEINDAEKAHFYELREIESQDYQFRNKIFWPLWGLSLLLLDQIITMPSTKNNKTRILFNIIVGIPFVSVVVSGFVFYREKFESQEYAFSLCEKYDSCKEE